MPILREEMIEHVRRNFATRGRGVPATVSQVLGTAAAGWIIQDRSSPLHVPLDPSFHDDVAAAIVHHYIRGESFAPTTDRQFRPSARAMVRSTLDQLASSRPPADVDEILASVALGRWDPGDIPFMLKTYGQHVAAMYLAGR